jgi:[protein-PII] uridylyltransferase
MTDPNPARNFYHTLNHQSRRDSLIAGRHLLKEFNQQQFDQFDQGQPIETLIKERTSFIDQMLKKIWDHFFPQDPDEADLSLIAVGGYGRGELQPYSDIDLLILGDNKHQHTDTIGDFITYLWDLGFEVGHAVRDLEECITAGKADVTTATNLLEARWLSGNYEAFISLQNLFNLKQFWPSQAFFQAKLAEQTQRHKRYHNTLYQLEPNIKESPGGLRDIQTILWVAKRHFGASSIEELMQHNFITLNEYKEIRAAYLYLNRIRFALHRLRQRHEDRLLFDNQQSLAAAMNPEPIKEVSKAVEAFMKPYYQNVHVVARLNEILLQHFREEIFDTGEERIEQINPRFRLVDDYLDVIRPNLFEKNPTALLEIFIILENYDHLVQGIRSRTIRLIRDNLHRIDDQFRADPINKALFMEIFRQPKGVNAALSRMYFYGILAAYLPAFARITGLMQFNIFHAYTVDEHTMLVIRNLRRFYLDDYAYEFPTAHQVAKQICKPEILLLAGLFHDIAKGQKGDHEKLGAIDAKEFSFRHNLNQRDAHLLSWLVRHHLEFSYVAQKKDLSDPEIIAQFAAKMGTQERLDNLYLLTLADVRATSDDVWNDWKNQLFLQLYHSTTQALDASQTLPQDRAKQAIFHKEKASELLKQYGLASSAFQPFWKTFENTDFFSRQTPSEIARITRNLYQSDPNDINLRLQSRTNRGATELIIYMHDREYLFSQFTQALDHFSLNIVEAKIYSGENNMTLVIIYLLDHDHCPITDANTLERTQAALLTELEHPPQDRPLTHSLPPRRIRVFETPTEIHFHPINDELTELSITTKDIPGLLAKIGQAFKQCQIKVHDAKINTIGERAEDVFQISTLSDDGLTRSESKERLAQNLLDLIEPSGQDAHPG